MGQRTADRAAVADLRVADLSGSVREQRQFAAEQTGLGQVVMAGEGPHSDFAAIVADIRELLEPADVHQDLGHGQAQLHERQQRMPPGQELCLVATLGRQVQGLVHRPGPPVSEGSGDQLTHPSLAARTALTML